jgi:flagellar basal-body rod protein FlgC
MDFFTSMKISSSGLSVQRKRMEAISSNLANAETTRTAEGGPYRRQDVVVTALPVQDDFNAVLKSELGESLMQTLVTKVIRDQSEPRAVFNPSHPDANEQGVVAMPNVDMVTEMVNMVTTSRSFEANVTAIEASKSMAQRAIELGR